MKPPGHVRKNLRWWKWFPWLDRTANTIHPWIYLPPDTYNDLCSANPSPQSMATLRHEEVHLERQKDTGLLVYGFKYFFSRRFRYQEEMLAIEAQMKYLKSQRVVFDIVDRARRLSSSEYLWCVSFETAISDLEKIQSSI